MKACARCGRERLLVALHGDRGGPDVCLECSGKLVEHGRYRRQTDKRADRALTDIFFGRDHCWEPDAQSVKDLLVLVHPDLHTPARKDAATNATALLTEMLPYAKPRSSRRRPEETLAGMVGRNGSASDFPQNGHIPVTQYPCAVCKYLPPDFYCNPCRERWKVERRKKMDRDNKRRRENRRRHRGGWLLPCATCGEAFRQNRSDQRYCKPACRQKAYRKRVAS